jgi:hypothetical protein
MIGATQARLTTALKENGSIRLIVCVIIRSMRVYMQPMQVCALLAGDDDRLIDRFPVLKILTEWDKNLGKDLI